MCWADYFCTYLDSLLFILQAFSNKMIQVVTLQKLHKVLQGSFFYALPIFISVLNIAEYQTLLLINQSNETSIHNDKKDTLQVSPLKNFDKTAEADFDKTVDDRQKPEGRTNSDDLGRPTKLSSGKCSKPIESELQPSSASSTTASECMSVTSMTSVKSSKSLQTKDANNDFK